MELIKNIFFNTDRLTSNTTVKISYTGKFFQDGSTNVYIHYGFGNNWDGLVDTEMTKTELGFQIEVNLLFELFVMEGLMVVGIKLRLMHSFLMDILMCIL